MHCERHTVVLQSRHPLRCRTQCPVRIFIFQEPTANLGILKTNGVDVGFAYNVRATPIGGFRFTLDLTHVNSYTNDSGGVKTEYAGTYSKQFGNDVKWRGLASASWDFRGFNALISEQWIGKLDVTEGVPFAANTDANPTLKP